MKSKEQFLKLKHNCFDCNQAFLIKFIIVLVTFLNICFIFINVNSYFQLICNVSFEERDYLKNSLIRIKH